MVWIATNEITWEAGSTPRDPELTGLKWGRSIRTFLKPPKVILMYCQSLFSIHRSRIYLYLVHTLNLIELYLIYLPKQLKCFLPSVEHTDKCPQEIQLIDDSLKIAAIAKAYVRFSSKHSINCNSYDSLNNTIIIPFS